MKTKKGELTSKQLVTIIILIVSFAIILLFFFMLNLKGTIDKESCRNSVVMRGALPLGKNIVQLKCKTQDVCLSMGDDCDVYREDMITIKVDNENELAEEMVGLLYDCWWMMGEGKVNYISSGVGFDETFCSICSRVYFDKKIQENYEDEEGISYSKIYNFMQTTKVPNKDETYMFDFYGLNSLDNVRAGLLEQENAVDIYAYKINPEKEYVVLTSIMKSTSNWEIAGTVIGGIAGGVLGTIIPIKGNILGVIIGASGGSSLGMWLGPADIKYMIPRYLEFDGQELEALDCKEYMSEG